MARTVGIGLQSFEKIQERHCFYIDQTKFIQEWWENEDEVTLYGSGIGQSGLFI